MITKKISEMESKRTVRVMLILFMVTPLLCSCESLTGMTTEKKIIEIEIPESYQEAVAGSNIWFTIRTHEESIGDELVITLYQGDTTRYETRTIMNSSYARYEMHIPQEVQGQALLRAEIQDLNSHLVANDEKEITIKGEEAGNVSTDSLLELALSIPKEYSNLFPNEDLLLSIRLINHASTNRVDAFLELTISNNKGELIHRQQETVAVETQANFVRTIPLQNKDTGRYTATAIIYYSDGKTARSHKDFLIVEEDTNLSTTNSLIMVGGGLIVLIIIVVLHQSKDKIQELRTRQQVDRIVRNKMRKKR